MTPGTSARLGNRSSDSHICSPTTTTDLSLRFLPGLLANHEMAKTVDPGAPENLYPENAFKAALLKRTRAQRIPFRPGDRYSNKGRIHSRRPILSFSFFACKTAADHTFRLGPRFDRNPLARAFERKNREFALPAILPAFLSFEITRKRPEGTRSPARRTSVS